jgi:lysophospholipase L1-like esterase
LLLPGAVRAAARWELVFRLPAVNAGFSVSVDGGKPQRFQATPESVGKLERWEAQGAADGSLEVSKVSGAPELFGVVVESAEAGVVVDTIALDGARAATWLAWDGAAWTEALAARKPALVVVALGTNEAFGDGEPARFLPHFEALFARIESAAPDADCLLLGPTDTSRTEASVRAAALDPRLAELAERLGCGYFSILHAMGPGGMVAWQNSEPKLGAADGIHLTVAGYEKLGDAVLERLLGPKPAQGVARSP